MTWAFDVAARTLCQEARGEPIEGQTAVAWVIKNRLADGRWGHSLASVCLWRGQFSGWYVPSDPNFAYACSLADTDATLSHMQSLLQTVLDSDDDPTNGATHYFNPVIVKAPAWVEDATPCGKFGRQSFYKGVN